MKERKCFGCGSFGHIICHCRNMKEEEPAWVFSNKWEVLKDRVMQKEEGRGSEVKKNRKEILREERAKREAEV